MLASGQVYPLPAVIWVRVTPDRTPLVSTGTGAVLLTVELSPSSP